MKMFFSFLVVLLCLSVPSVAKDFPPKVRVYSRVPVESGRANTLICHVTDFHPPEISIELLKDGDEMVGAKDSDLGFEQDWHYYQTKHVHFTPKGEEFGCRVTHMGKAKTYILEPDA